MKFLIVLLVLPAFLEVYGKPNERSISERGLFVKRSRNMCRATGEPHYKTFDNKFYDFMGFCKLVLVTDYCPNQGNDRKKMGRFEVVVNTGNCARNGRPSPVSCVNSVDVTIEGKTVHLEHRSFSPAPMYDNNFSVTKLGGLVQVKANKFGMTIHWNKAHGIWVYLDDSMRGKVCGMCGNFDGNKHNDQYGSQWSVSGECGSNAPRHPCHKNPHRRAEAEKNCNVIRSNNFKNCEGHADREALYNDCVYDVCESSASLKESSCKSFKEAVQDCQEKSGKPMEYGHLSKLCYGTP